VGPLSGVEPIRVTLSRDQISNLIYQQLEDEQGDVDGFHARHAITFAIDALNDLGLLVREGEAC
jgi:hypothetical protein